MDFESGEKAAPSATIIARHRTWRRLIRGLLACGLLIVGLLAALGCYALLLPAEGSSVPVTGDVGLWDDVGPVYDRISVTPSPPPVRTSVPNPLWIIVPRATPGPLPPPPPVDSIPYEIVIPSIGVDAPVVTKGLDVNQVPVVPLNAHQVAWYNFSAQPGTGGNAVFAGHVTWSGRAVFYSLNKVVAGDQILIKKPDGQALTYTVVESFTVSEDDPSAPERVMGPTSTDMVTIITCDGDFYYTGDPVFRGSYTNRRVIRGTLTSRSAS
jgi:LPXTG-site transpeptidase (sortase) family protein